MDSKAGQVKGKHLNMHRSILILLCFEMSRALEYVSTVLLLAFVLV